MKEYYAHIRNDGTVQSVKEHLFSVAELCGRYAQKINMPRTGKLLGLIHDGGKLNSTFGNYIKLSSSGGDVRHLKGKIDHSTVGVRILYEKFGMTLPVEIVGNAVLGHHGGLVDFLDIGGNSKFLERVMNKELPYYEESKNNFYDLIIEEKDLRSLYKEVEVEVRGMVDKLKHLGGDLRLNLSFVTRYLFSCLIDADRTDTFMFMENVEREKTFDFSWEDFERKLEKKIGSFSIRFPVDETRSDISIECMKKGLSDNTGIYRLNVPTGGGKTLAAMRYALNHRKTYNKDRIFSFIPLTTIIDQTAKEYKEIFLDPSLDEDLILEHHSNVQVDKIDSNEPAYSLREERRKYLCERWENPIVLSTFVQFFNSFFSGGTKSVRRLHHMSNSILIFDEVQTVPVKLVYLFNSVVNFMEKIMGSTIILSTATQPTYEYLRNQTYRMNVDKVGIVDSLGDLSEKFKRVILTSRVEEEWTIESLAEEVSQKIEEESSILIIVNKRKTARSIFKTIREKVSDDAKVYHLSTNMVPYHRKKVIEKIKDTLRSGDKCICVSTQIMQAGIDLSFSLVYRDIAGIDSVVQSAGRCNRHGEKEIGVVYLIDLNDPMGELKDILEQITTTKVLLSEYKRNPDRFDGDLMSNASIDFYFREYFSNVEGRMKYNIDNGRTNLVNLLSKNEGVDPLVSKYNNQTTMLKMAFSTAAKYFKVIDNEVITVICPYVNDPIVKDIRLGNIFGDRLKKALIRAQQFTLGLYEHEFNKLVDLGALSETAIPDVYWLDTRFYDEDIGLTDEPKLNRLSVDNNIL